MEGPRNAAAMARTCTPLVHLLLAAAMLLGLYRVAARDIFGHRSTASVVEAVTRPSRHRTDAVDLKHYPPDATPINDLDGALSSEAVYGFVYDSSYPEDVAYGTYNWCNMPHVRRQEYQRPSSEYKLRYVEIIQRHHKRTTYSSNAFPVESYEWNCDDEGLFHYGQPSTGNRSSRVYWEQAVPGSGINPFVPTGFLGSCKFPQITGGGLDDSWQHGKDLYGVYHDLLALIPDSPSSKVSFRVTQNVITSQVAGMVISGMFGTQENVPLHIQASGIDSLEPSYPCKTSKSLYDSVFTSDVWKDHIRKASAVFATIDDISGVATDDPEFHASFDHYYDNLSARLCHAKPLPCKLVEGRNSSTCITRELADTVFRIGQWEYSYLYRDSPTSLDAAVGSMGVWIAELAQHLRDVVAGKGEIVYFHNFAHDGSLSRVLAVLQVDVMVWPGMGAEVGFELYQDISAAAFADTDPSSYLMRVLWNGKVLKSSNPTLGLLDMVPLKTILSYFDGLVGVNASLVKGKCEGRSPNQISHLATYSI